MEILAALFLFTITISGGAAYFISGRVRKQLQSTGNPYARTVSVITFILSMGLILVGLLVLIGNNIHFER
jgi:uncharacterized membrane protein